MIETILGNPIERLQKKSDSILDVFTKTLTELEDVNNKIGEEEKKKEVEKKKLEEDLQKLGGIKANNSKYAEKIKKIFE